MQSRKISLTGFIEEKWLADGGPELTWADLLKRTIDADIQLAKLGFNPAPKFRQLRNDKNQVSMYTYINGFYQSPFAPNHRSRGAAKSNKISPDTFRRFAFSSKTIQHQHLVPQSTFRGDLRTPARLPSIVITPNAVQASNLLKLYRELFAEHPHDTLPLETSLPREIRFACRDQYRIIMTMILSGSMGDLQLTEALARLFSRRRSFNQFRGITNTELRNELKECGFGYNDPDRAWKRRAASGVYFNLYFGRWNEDRRRTEMLSRIRARGFGPKFQPLLEAYAFGDSDAFPLDTPAFRTLKSFGFYTRGTLDEAREDVSNKLRDCSDLKLIDFHELIAVSVAMQRRSDGTRLSRRQQNVIMGWNGWRILSLKQNTFISTRMDSRQLDQGRGLGKRVYDLVFCTQCVNTRSLEVFSAPRLGPTRCD